MEVEIHLLIASLIVLCLAIFLIRARHKEELPSPNLWSVFKNAGKKERRIFPRYKTLLRAKYKSPLEEGISWIKDFSRGGVRLFLNSLDVGTIVALQIDLPYDRTPVFVQGNIAWKRGTDSGLCFGAAEHEDLTKVLRYVGHREELKRQAV